MHSRTDAWSTSEALVGVETAQLVLSHQVLDLPSSHPLTTARAILTPHRGRCEYHSNGDCCATLIANREAMLGRRLVESSVAADETFRGECHFSCFLCVISRYVER